MRLYFDNNVYNRPFDDRSVPRNRYEADAVWVLLGVVEAGEAELVSSFVVEGEHDRLGIAIRRRAVRGFIRLARGYVEPTAPVFERARRLEASGLTPNDALHIAAAEHAGVDYFVTCDDKLSKKARRARRAVMQKTSKLSDEEIDRLGYEALKEKLGPVGAARYIGLWLERSRDDYLKIKGKIFEGMTVEEIYAEAARLDSARRSR